MMPIVECVPNFSVGREPVTLEPLYEAVRRAKGVSLLDVHTDTDHNRSVFTLTGSPGCVAEAAFLLAEAAVETIDLTRHTGAHPRMGAVDVIPFVPVSGISMEECVTLARHVAERIATELALPVFLYENAASSPERTNLADIRRGGFEGLAEKLTQPEWKPDFGPVCPHPTAGAVAVGARKPLIAYNMWLNTPDVRVAKAVAKAVRASGGGLPYVKAIGLLIPSRNCTQVSMNLTDYEQTPVYRVFEQVREEAAKYGVCVTGSELVGLIPMEALTASAAYFLQLTPYEPKRQILERQIWERIQPC